MPPAGPTPDDAEPIGPGRLVLIVGPSGAGKDTLLAEVRRRLADRADIHFATRVVTRPADATEACIAATPEAFASLRAARELALTWEAHGIAYGIPADIDVVLRSGGTVVASVSRTVVAEARRRYARTCVALIDASPQVRRARLLARGRETVDGVAARLARDIADADVQPDVRLVNDGTVQAGADRLSRIVQGN